MPQVKDIPDQVIIEACNACTYRDAPFPDVALAAMYPRKVILRKMEQMIRRGILEYGVSLRSSYVIAEHKRRTEIGYYDSPEFKARRSRAMK